MKETYEFSTKNLYMRTITADDTDQIVAWRSDPEVTRYFYQSSSFCRDEHVNWFENIYKDSEQRYDFIIYAEEVPIGFVAISEIDRVQKSGVIGYAIANHEYQRKGYGSESVIGLIKFAKDVFGLREISAEVHHENTSSIKMIEQIGFVQQERGQVYSKYTFRVKTIVIATIKSWNIQNAHQFAIDYPNVCVHIMTQKDELTKAALEQIKPDYVFFPHWSYIIPEDIFQSFQCVVFHGTDVPFGRGGSPIQNLISRGIYDTKISAIKVEKEIDAGDVYMKVPINIEHGTVEDVLKKMSDIIFTQMIPEIMEKELAPKKQQGTITCFPRRTEKDGEIKREMSSKEIYDYIRMLDGEGYPNAYIQFGKYRISFKNVVKDGNRLETTAVWEEI